MNVFEAVKRNVATRQAAEIYGIRVNRYGMAVCPFHNDKNPSMKVDMRFHCFACQTMALHSVFQKEGKEAVEMKPGDCINIPAGVRHWHGAAPDEWFSHLAIEVPGNEISNEWREPVTDETYGLLLRNLRM